MNKQEVIKEKWIAEIGEKNFKENDLDIEGYIHFSLLPQALRSKLNINGAKEFDFIEGGFYRPKSLSGIENNNGWVKIEADRSNLPTDAKDSGLDYFWFTKEGNSYIGESWPVRMASFISETHFRPLEKHQPPLY